ncbi:MAG TPA: Uma2 family endonuclease [Kofleriaceae bacterium]|nr:Uma2 family endonuclease [Kofleriaceae bacterium]
MQNTIADYLRFENASNDKHEFVRGLIVAMTGGSINHARLVTSVAVQLGSQLRGRTCEAFSSELRIRVAGDELIFYPDASVVCTKPIIDIEDKHAINNPTVIVEVTSPSTAAYDRTEKFAFYQLIETLREYVIVSHAQQLVEVFRLGDDGQWALVMQAAKGKLRLESVDCELDIEDLYARVTGL